MGTTYVCWKGLEEIAAKVRGDEHISIGIRPYGFHAGNELTLFVYPWHFCNLVKKMGKEVRFTFYISLNDVEPEGLSYLYPKGNGYEYKREELTLKEEVPFEYNVFPKDTSFQYTPDKATCCASMADHWSKVIEQKVLRLKDDFPNLTFHFVKSSSILHEPVYQKAIEMGIAHPEVLGKIANQYEKVCFADGWLSWTGAICPSCHSAQGKTSLFMKSVLFACSSCGKECTLPMSSASYWMHHMLLLAPRLKLFKIDLFFRGYDHYACNHIPINEQLYEALYGEKLDICTIVPPLIVRADGKKMSKTWSNEQVIDTHKLLELAAACDGEKIIL